MTWIDEHSLLLVVCGVAGAALLGWLWFGSGRRPLLYAVGLLVLLTLGVLIVEQGVVTDKEAITSTLHRIADDVARNDVTAALRHVHSQATDVRGQARAELPRYEFHEVSIKRNLKIAVKPTSQPKQATAEFNVMVVLSERAGPFQNQPVPRFVIVSFAEEDGQWRVTAYEHHRPQQSVLKRPDNAN